MSLIQRFKTYATKEPGISQLTGWACILALVCAVVLLFTAAFTAVLGIKAVNDFAQPYVDKVVIHQIQEYREDLEIVNSFTERIAKGERIINVHDIMRIDNLRLREEVLLMLAAYDNFVPDTAYSIPTPKNNNNDQASNSEQKASAR